MYKTVLFDLDGTLTDSGIGITNSVMHALRKMNVQVEERSAYYKFIGPPLLHSFQEYYGFSEEKSQLAVTYFHEYFSTKGIFENRVYEGIETMLMQLSQMELKLCVATSKPEAFAKQILEHFCLEQYFSFVGGSTMDETRTDKAAVIRYVLESEGIRDTDSVLMVGDREHDIIGAKKNGIDSMGVLYGYGNQTEFEEAGADYVVEKPMEIAQKIRIS
ncbi:MAG: HAD family hydrolase [Hespellia sp.]|nr:HAD family hydrolase [Hespellia sp.]